jgi:tight adherence protein B
MTPALTLPAIAIAGSPTTALKVGAVLLWGLSLWLGTWGVLTDTTGPVARAFLRYISWIERRLRLMFIFTSGRRIVAIQGVALVLYVALAVPLGVPFWGAGLLVIGAAPAIWIESERGKRLSAIELQLDGFVLALANALKSTPSIGSALNSVISVVSEPIRSEAEMATKEMKVGSTLDQALLHMAARIGSRSVDTALSAILIGQKVGGNLPKVLETTANSLREMQRLDGVIRTKTADGRMQLWFVGAMPLGLVLGMNAFWPGYFDPLTESLFGYCIIVMVIVCWISSLLLARKILAVDI